MTVVWKDKTGMKKNIVGPVWLLVRKGGTV
jgi:hypothetical protein